MAIIWPIISLFILGIISSNRAAAPLENDDKPLASSGSIHDYRLPTTILPSNYDILITPYLTDAPPSGKERFSFDGVVSISLTASEENVKEIIMHQKGLEFDHTKIKLVLVEGEIEKDITIQKPEFNDTTDLFKIVPEVALEIKKQYKLTFYYQGKISNDMLGFYRSSYVNEDGKEIWIASTQFQSNYARRAFPCFDEPKFKATFTVSINHEKYYHTVVSNMKIINAPVNIADDRVLTTFEKSPKMSAYLVAFLISDFKERSNDHNTFSVVARKEFYDQTEYSYTEGQLLLQMLDTYTNLPYNTLGVDKMHMAAIPDFSAGAMENWGLITYRESGLLYDPHETTDLTQQYIVLIIAHEQAHMWFGNYVTCEWWSYTWLNEGFATYFQYFGSQEIHSDWKIDKQFVVLQMHSVFTTDSLAETHPMTAKNADTPEQVSKMVAAISYNKAASIIRMFKYAMGEDNFKAGLRAYLKERQLSWATPEHLFTEFEKQWTKNKPEKVREFFTDWTEQVGYPVVNINLSDDGKIVELTQNRFLLEKDAGDEKILYTIPFTYATNKDTKFNPDQITFLKKSTDVQKIELKEPAEWVIGNIQQIGYFRVNYDEHMWHKLHHALLEDKYGKIHELNRAHLVDDLFNFGRSGALKYDLVFSVLDYLRNETNYLPWTAAFNGFSYLATRLGAEHKGVLGNLLTKSIKKVYDQLGFEQKTNEKRLDTYNRAKVLAWACKYGHGDCTKNATELFNKYREKESEKVPKNIRSTVYCSAIREASDDVNYKFLIEKFEKSKIATETTLILASLGCVKSDELIKKYYKYILDNKVRKQDKSSAMTSLFTENPESPEKVFDLIVEDHEKLGKAFGNGDSDVATVLSSIASRFTNEDQKKKLEAFIEGKGSKLNEAAKESLNKAIKTAEKNLKWTSEYLNGLLLAMRGGAAENRFSIFLLALTLIICSVR